MKKRNIPFVVLIIVSFVVILIACGKSQAQAPAAYRAAAQVEQPRESEPAVDAPQSEAEHEQAEAADAEAEHQETAAHVHSPEEHMAGSHGVPAEAAVVVNPVLADEKSIAAGAALFAQNCAVCHGETGKGDGPAAETLEVKPADLHADHVQGLSDGALFYIISHGRPKTPMPAWQGVLSETDRWQVVNFLRTFKDDKMVADEAGEHADEGEAHIHAEEVGEHTHADQVVDQHDDTEAGEDHHHEGEVTEDHHHDDGQQEGDGHTHSDDHSH